MTSILLDDVWRLSVSQARIVHILNNGLSMHKVCAKWVPHKLIAVHKEKRVKLFKQLLEVLKRLQ